MNVNVTREGNDAALKITVAAKDVDKSFKQAVARIANQVRIPGFRPGKAPRNIIEMHYGKAAVKEEAFNICVNRAYQEALETEKLMPVSDPEVQEESKTFEAFTEGKDFEMDVKVILKPEPELGEYKGIHVDKKEAKVTDEDVDKALEDLRSRGAKMVDTDDDTIIEKGDFAIIDFAGTVDG
ncbi:MAG TPA: trigger factor, partial [Acidaminococcaceae bacterium]|nr:trigger factor [Acidaminococcaceae bacterium]